MLLMTKKYSLFNTNLGSVIIARKGNIEPTFIISTTVENNKNKTISIQFNFLDLLNV
jgi:hypothetical protein